MQKKTLHINGLGYDAVTVLEGWIGEKPSWKTKGLEFLIQLMDPSETPVKFHTSGTTGDPQEIRFSKKQIFTSAANTCRFFDLHSESRLLLCLPADFVAGRMMMARAFYSGAKLIWFQPSLNPLKNMVEVDFAAFTPAQVATIVSDPGTLKIFETIRTVIIGGGEITNELEKDLMKMDQDIYATYGMTETLTHVAVRKMGDPVFHCIYNDAHFALDANGCLTISIPHLLHQKIITRDVVELMDEKSFIWKGRLDHVINSGGIKIQAEELEKKLEGNGLLKEGTFYISSKRDPVFGEAPVIVLLNEATVGDVATLLQTFNEVLNKHEMLKGVVFLDKFERTETGKIKRQKF